MTLAPPSTESRTRLKRAAVVGVVVLLAVELWWGWPSLTRSLSSLRSPDPWLLVPAVLAELAAMGAYARMQRRLLLRGGAHPTLPRMIALTYAAHSLSVTLPGGPAFSTRLNFRQMRRMGATPAIATWVITLSGLLSTAGLAVLTVAGALTAGDEPAWLPLAGLVVLAGVVTVGVRRLGARPGAVQRMAQAVMVGVNRVRRAPAERGVERVAAFVDDLGAARLRPVDTAFVGSLAVLNWLLDALCLWLCLNAVGVHGIGVGIALLAFCAGMAVGSLTIVPGGLGIIDSALILALVGGGVDAGTAIAGVVLYRVISFGFVIGAGWLAWLILRRRDRGIEPPWRRLAARRAAAFAALDACSR